MEHVRITKKWMTVGGPKIEENTTSYHNGAKHCRDLHLYWPADMNYIPKHSKENKTIGELIYDNWNGTGGNK